MYFFPNEKSASAPPQLLSVIPHFSFTFFLYTHNWLMWLIYSMSFFALKYRRRYSTCQVARPNKQHMLNILKNNTRLFVDSGEWKRKRRRRIIIENSVVINIALTYRWCCASLPHVYAWQQSLVQWHLISPPNVSSPLPMASIYQLQQSVWQRIQSKKYYEINDIMEGFIGSSNRINIGEIITQC